MATLLREQGTRIYRMKGVLAIAGASMKFVFQGVHMIFSGEPLEEWREGEPRQSRMIFIGRGLERAVLTNGFAACK